MNSAQTNEANENEKKRFQNILDVREVIQELYIILFKRKETEEFIIKYEDDTKALKGKGTLNRVEESNLNELRDKLGEKYQHHKHKSQDAYHKAQQTREMDAFADYPMEEIDKMIVDAGDRLRQLDIRFFESKTMGNTLSAKSRRKSCSLKKKRSDQELHGLVLLEIRDLLDMKEECLVKLIADLEGEPAEAYSAKLIADLDGEQAEGYAYQFGN